MQATSGHEKQGISSPDKAKALQAILDQAIDGKKVFGTSFAMRRGDQVWQGASGNIAIDQPYFIASTTKLFTTALILKLREAGKLSLEDTLAKHFDNTVLDGLHVYKGQSYAHAITIRHLLAHTSGLPDYFQGKGAGGRSLELEIKEGKDRSWTFAQALEITKGMKPLFAPGTKGKAHYADANFQLLGKIIEQVTGKPYADNCNERIIRPLGLGSTYLYQDPQDSRPKALHFQKGELRIPKAMTSFGADGGMVSTSADMLVFIEAFITGKLFPAAYLPELQVWNRIFFPMRSGIGLHLFKLPWIFNPTGAVPSFIGHSGLSGALAFYSPKENIYVAGTVNQVAHPDMSFRTMIKLVLKAMKP